MENSGIDIGITRESLRFPDNYNRFRQLASEHLKQRENTGRNPNLEAKYAHRFVGKDGNTRVNVQLRDADSEAKPDVLKLKDGDQTREVKVVARVWFTEKDKEQAGNGHAVCYKLGEDGFWYKQTADKFTYNKEENTDYWTLGKVQEVDDNEEELFLDSRLESIQAPVKQAA